MSRRQASLSLLRSKWEDLARGISEPGFIGPVPYLLLLRWLVLGGIGLRFLIFPWGKSTSERWSLVVVSFGVTAVLALLATYVTARPALRRSRRVQGLFIVSDILLISFFYFLTGDAQSDLFLLYYLPIFAATVYLGGRAMLGMFIGITVAFICVNVILLLPGEALLSAGGPVFSAFLPRMVFLLSVFALSSYLFQFEGAQRLLLGALIKIGDATASTLELDSALDDILRELTEKLGFEFATVSLVDKYRGVIETVRGRNVPPEWVERARHQLDNKDIQADVVRNREVEVIEGWNDRLDEDIYKRFGHENLARIFAPLVADGEVVGTIEAGCRRERRAEVLTPESVQAVERLGQGRGKAVARARPYVLLELIANQAIEIIGADSASIHVYQFGEPLLEAGAGRASEAFLRKFPPRPNGIGRQAMRTGEAIVVDGPQEVAGKHSDIYDEGIRAIAAFPLSLGAHVEGVLYVHFWRERRFSQAEVELERVFARQIEVVIQNHLLLKGISEAAQRAWALPGLQNVMQSLALAPSLNLERVLEDVAQNVLYMLGADNVTLYQYFQGGGRFEAPPVMKGHFRDPDSMKTKVYPDDIVRRIVKKGRARFISDVSSETMMSGPRKDGVKRPRFVEREGVRSSAAVVLRAGGTDEIVGLMFVNYRTPHEFSNEDKRTINALASSAAVAIKTARLYEQVSQDLERRDKELDALRTVDRAIVEGPLEMQPVLEFILEKGMEVVEAPAGGIMWFSPWENVLELRAQRGFPEDQRTLRLHPGEGIVGLVAERMESILVHDIAEEKWAGVYKPVVPGTRSELAVPLMDESGLLGVLNVEHPEVAAFNEDDRALLETLAVQAIIAIHSVDLYQKLERQIKSLRALSTIATRIQDPGYTLDTMLRLLLTGVTVGEGLGFSRAMLFLIEDEGMTLRGKMAIGAQTREEAEATWRALGEEADRAQKIGKDILEALLDQAEAFSIAVADGREHDQPLSMAVQSVYMPIEEEAGAPAVCVLKGQAIVVQNAQPDPFRTVVERITQPGDMGHAFVCVPLVGKEGAIGALVVDNRFLASEREIDEDAISCLEAFAGMMAMSVENARLQARLAEEERLKTWKDFTAQIAHTIGTRIGVIEGWVTMLRSHLLEEKAVKVRQVKNTRALLEKLFDGILKAKEVLNEFRTFTVPLQLQSEELDLVQLLEAVVREIQHNVKFPIVPSLPSEPLIILGDPTRLSDAFIELIKNAQEAMQQDAGRAPQITITASVETAPATPGNVARVEFANTGPGIPEAHKERIFDPYFSTKGTGSGLGLTIVRKIIEEHQGTIEEVGDLEEGARFVVRLTIVEPSPCLEQGGGGNGQDPRSGR